MTNPANAMTEGMDIADIEQVQSMGTLLSRMTSQTSGEIKFDNDQIRAVMEIILPRIATNLPGLPPGMECTVDADEDGKGWTLRIRKP